MRLNPFRRRIPVAPIKQEHSDAPVWGIKDFPLDIKNRVKGLASMEGLTITEYLVRELTVVAERLEADPTATAQDYVQTGDLLDRWSIKHFPAELRLRLKDVASHEGTQFYPWLVRELAGVVGG